MGSGAPARVDGRLEWRTTPRNGRLDPMYARLELRLSHQLEKTTAASRLADCGVLVAHDPRALQGTLFKSSAAAVNSHVVYAGTNGGYVLIVLWYSGDSLDVIVEPQASKVRRSVDDVVRALKRILASHKPRVEAAYLVEEGTNNDLEKGTVATRSYFSTAFTTQTILTSVLTLALSGILALQTPHSAASFLLAGASALSVFI